MPKPIHFVLLVSICLTWSCASKRYARQGFKFEKAGHYEIAADRYYNAVVKNDQNLEAHMGLKKTGQITLEYKLSRFDELYNANQVDDAVLAFDDAERFYAKLSQVDCQLFYPTKYDQAFDEVKNIYLEEQYLMALSLLEKEEFYEAESVFKAIEKIDPYYLDISELKEKAHCEPIYRKGKELMESDLNRKAFSYFGSIVQGYPNYKDARYLKEEAFQKAIVTMAITGVKNYSNDKNEGIVLAKLIEKKIIASKMRFVNVIDLETNKLLKQAYSAKLSNASNDNYAIDASKLLDAKLILNITLNNYSEYDSGLKSETKKGFVKEIVPAKDEQSKVTYKYHKVEYKEFERDVRVTCRMRYQLISSETGRVLVSDVIGEERHDDIHYAEYRGKKKELIPGYWKDDRNKSYIDDVRESDSEVKALQKLLKAKRNVLPAQALHNKLFEDIARQVTRKIVDYDAQQN